MTPGPLAPWPGRSGCSSSACPATGIPDSARPGRIGHPDRVRSCPGPSSRDPSFPGRRSGSHPGSIIPGPIVPGPIMLPGMSVSVTLTTVPGSAGTSQGRATYGYALIEAPDPAFRVPGPTAARAKVLATPSTMAARPMSRTSRKRWIDMALTGVRAVTPCAAGTRPRRSRRGRIVQPGDLRHGSGRAQAGWCRRRCARR